MDIFKLREMTSRGMDATEKEKVSKFMSNLTDTVRDTLKDRKGRETTITSFTESLSPICSTDLGIRIEFTIKRKYKTRIIVLNLIPSNQKILLAYHKAEDMAGDVARHEYPLTLEGARKSALKVFDLIDFEDCFKVAA